MAIERESTKMAMTMFSTLHKDGPKKRCQVQPGLPEATEGTFRSQIMLNKGLPVKCASYIDSVVCSDVVPLSNVTF